MPDRLVNQRFPLSSKYNPDWLLEGAFGGYAVWLREWLTESLSLKPRMLVLDLGFGRASPRSIPAIACGTPLRISLGTPDSMRYVAIVIKVDPSTSASLLLPEVPFVSLVDTRSARPALSLTNTALFCLVRL